MCGVQVSASIFIMIISFSITLRAGDYLFSTLLANTVLAIGWCTVTAEIKQHTKKKLKQYTSNMYVELKRAIKCSQRTTTSAR